MKAESSRQTASTGEKERAVFAEQSVRQQVRAPPIPGKPEQSLINLFINIKLKCNVTTALTVLRKQSSLYSPTLNFFALSAYPDNFP